MAAQSDLSPYKHSEECNKLISEFKECHRQHPFKKFTGICNPAKFAMDKCLKAELEATRQQKSKKHKRPKKNENVEQQQQ